MVLQYILHQFCTLQNSTVPGVTPRAGVSFLWPRLQILVITNNYFLIHWHDRFVDSLLGSLSVTPFLFWDRLGSYTPPTSNYPKCQWTWEKLEASFEPAQHSSPASIHFLSNPTCTSQHLTIISEAQFQIYRQNRRCRCIDLLATEIVLFSPKIICLWYQRWIEDRWSFQALWNIGYPPPESEVVDGKRHNEKVDYWPEALDVLTYEFVFGFPLLENPINTEFVNMSDWLYWINSTQILTAELRRPTWALKTMGVCQIWKIWLSKSIRRNKLQANARCWDDSSIVNTMIPLKLHGSSNVEKKKTLYETEYYATRNYPCK